MSLFSKISGRSYGKRLRTILFKTILFKTILWPISGHVTMIEYLRWAVVHNRYIASQPFQFLGLGKIRLGLVFIVFIILSSVLALFAISVVSSHFAHASVETVPIPSRRPDVISTSPSYIRELMTRNDSANVYRDVYDDAFTHDSSYDGSEEDYEKELLSSIQEDTNPPDEYLLATSSAVRQPIIQPGQKGHEKALVSFTLDPNQVTLDQNLKEFLLEHAIKIIKNDPHTRLEIHAYASMEDQKEYSDIRRSLARALEVRGFMLEQNIDPSRLKITPMGQDTDDTTDDRIDLLFIGTKK